MYRPAISDALKLFLEDRLAGEAEQHGEGQWQGLPVPNLFCNDTHGFFGLCNELTEHLLDGKGARHSRLTTFQASAKWR